MRIKVHHRTSYRYEQPAWHVVQYLRLSPSDTDSQHVRVWRVDIDADGRLRETRDAFGNRLHVFYCDGAVGALTVTVTGEVETDEAAGVVRGAPEPLPLPVYLRTTPLTRADAAIRALAEGARGECELATLHALNAAIFGRMAFVAGVTHTGTAAAEALAAGQGVCQDFAHLFVGAARHLGIPARYVSGHLSRTGDAALQGAAHAWAEAHVADLGWIGFDAANGISPDANYIRVACGLDYLDAAPVRGARRGGGGETLDVSVEAVPAQMQRQQ